MHIPMPPPAPAPSAPWFLGESLADWQAEESALDDALLASTRAAADAAERTASDHRAGLASIEALICASDAAHAASRAALARWETTGCPHMAGAAADARRAAAGR